MKIGVFDSGVGGLSVANAIKVALPEHDILFRNDAQHLPYGTKSLEDIYAYCLPVLQSLVDDGCTCIVIACNTVTTNLITRLRSELSVPLVGMEPMIKPAAQQSQTKTITVCATPRTLDSLRYAQLKRDYAPDVTVLEPDCSQWALLIEKSEMNEEYIRKAIAPTLRQGSDVIVLGCTHYHWIEAEIRAIVAGQAVVLQPEVPVIRRLQHVLEQLT